MISPELILVRHSIAFSAEKRGNRVDLFLVVAPACGKVNCGSEKKPSGGSAGGIMLVMSDRTKRIGFWVVRVMKRLVQEHVADATPKKSESVKKRKIRLRRTEFIPLLYLRGSRKKCKAALRVVSQAGQERQSLKAKAYSFKSSSALDQKTTTQKSCQLFFEQFGHDEKSTQRGGVAQT